MFLSAGLSRRILNYAMIAIGSSVVISPGHAARRRRARPRRIAPTPHYDYRPQIDHIENPLSENSALLIGDSLGIDGLTSGLAQLFIANKSFDIFNAYSACGFSPMSWVKPSHTPCGFRYVAGRLDTGAVINNYWGSHTTYAFSNLLDYYRPKTLFIQLGTNVYDAFRNKHVDWLTEAQQQTYIASIGAQVKSLVNQIAVGTTSVKKCVWISPPPEGRASAYIQNFVYEAIKLAAKPVCKVLNSRDFENFGNPYLRPSRDAQHLSEADSRVWANNVYAALQDLLKEPAAVITEAQRAEAAKPVAVVSPLSGELHFRGHMILRKVSPTPVKVLEATPYGIASIVYEWEVLDVIPGSGTYDKKIVRIAHPVLIAHKILRTYPIGTEVTTDVVAVPEKWEKQHRIEELDETQQDVLDNLETVIGMFAAEVDTIK